ncbi:M3 family metallopeptidase [Candidatus Peregrinibacteria bacterium]|nr:M3 family metallopeptidase [Candidatus Peregrinibacteria bacterium]
MPKPLADRLIVAVKIPGLIDYQFLGSTKALAAFEKAIRRSLDEAQGQFRTLVTMRKEDATFQNLVGPFFRMDESLELLWMFLLQYNDAVGTAHTRGLIAKLQPAIVRFSNETLLDEKFYLLLSTVRTHRGMSHDQKRSLDLLLRDRRLAGVELPTAKKRRLRAINARLSALERTFSNHELKSQNRFFHHFPDDRDIRAFPPMEKEMAKKEARRRNLPGFVCTLSAPSLRAVMKYCSNRSIRKRFAKESFLIASKGRDDNRPVILEILRLREEKARLLGFRDFADEALQNRMVRDLRKIQSTVRRVQRAAAQRAKRELEILRQHSGLRRLELWDVSYVANMYVLERFKVNDEALRPYFPLEQTVEGMFAIARRLFGVQFQRMPGASYAPDVRTFRVTRNGATIAFFILDLFARPAKRPGACCNCLRSSKVLGKNRILPIVLTMSNAGKSERETLLTHGDVQTMFHEFGHALHVMLNENTYANLSSFHTEWDFVELPSQLLENWCWERDALALFAKHKDTGAILPARMLRNLERKRLFLRGYEWLMQCEYALLDLALHTKSIPRTLSALDRFCLEHAKKHLGMLPIPSFWKKHCSFSHLFSGGYAAGYYSYLWSAILEADVFAKFKKHGILKKSMGEEFRRKILAQGTRSPGEELFEAFVGREPDVGAFLKKEGLLQ